MLQRALAVRIGLRCSAWLWLRFSIMWLAGNSASLPCTRDAWNMDHGSSEAVRPHDFGRSVVSLCLSVFMRSRRAAILRERERTHGEGGLGFGRKVGFSWDWGSGWSAIVACRNPLIPYVVTISFSCRLFSFVGGPPWGVGPFFCRTP